MAGFFDLGLDYDTTSTQVNLGIFNEPVEGTRFGIQYLPESDLGLETRAKISGIDGIAIGMALDNAGLLNSKVDLDMTLLLHKQKPPPIIGGGFCENRFD